MDLLRMSKKDDSIDSRETKRIVPSLKLDKHPLSMVTRKGFLELLKRFLERGKKKTK